MNAVGDAVDDSSNKLEHHLNAGFRVWKREEGKQMIQNNRDDEIFRDDEITTVEYFIYAISLYVISLPWICEFSG